MTNVENMTKVADALERCVNEIHYIWLFCEETVAAIKLAFNNKPSSISLMGDSVSLRKIHDESPTRYDTNISGFHQETIRSLAISLAAGAYERYLSTLLRNRFGEEKEVKQKYNNKKERNCVATTCLLSLKELLKKNDISYVAEQFVFVYNLCNYRHIVFHNNSAVLLNEYGKLEIKSGDIKRCLNIMREFAIGVFKICYPHNNYKKFNELIASPENNYTTPFYKTDGGASAPGTTVIDDLH